MKKSSVLKQEFIMLVQTKIGRLKDEERDFTEMLKKVKERKRRCGLCDILCVISRYIESTVLWDVLSCSVIQVLSQRNTASIFRV
jgi:hypothetical protein